MTGSIVLTCNNLSPDGIFNSAVQTGPYNRMTLNLNGLNLTGRRIGLKKLNMYYSWPNIRTTTTVTVGWRIGASYTNYTWTLPALSNYETVGVLNQSLQSFCIANGLYLINSTGNYVYYLELLANATTYKIHLNAYLVPTSLPVGFTAPSNFAGYPSVSVTPRMTIPAGSELISLLGFPAALYDGATTTTAFSSTYVPQLNPVSTIFLALNIASNDAPLNGSSTIIQCFTTRGSTYGGMLEVAPNEVSYYDIASNTNNLEVMFYDQNMNPLYVGDPQITVHLEMP